VEKWWVGEENLFVGGSRRSGFALVLVSKAGADRIVKNCGEGQQLILAES
jgi:hypothetical protein